MSANKIVILSDVHIGTTAPTNWYQRDLHEPYLRAFFDHVTANADSVAELVILGDLVDQWTYLPSERPPAFGDIVAANPGVFGPGGALLTTLTALDGRVTWLSGNHDMGVSAADVATLRDPAGRTLRYVDGPFHEPARGGGRIVCTHGHLYSIFNAPDRGAMPATGLPIGHFVTRLSALHSSRLLRPGQSVADLPDHGDPTGWLLAKEALHVVLQDFYTGDLGLAELILAALLDACGESRDLPVRLPDDTTMTVGQAIEAYAGLYERWKAGAGDRAVYGRDPGMPALMGTDAHNDLSHFAVVLGARYPLIVMGHTHAPQDLDEHLRFSAGCLYANTGFGCPSRIDMTDASLPRHPSFVELTVDPGSSVCTAAVRYAAEGPGGVRVADDPLTPPVSIGLT